MAAKLFFVGNKFGAQAFISAMVASRFYKCCAFGHFNNFIFTKTAQTGANNT